MSYSGVMTQTRLGFGSEAEFGACRAVLRDAGFDLDTIKSHLKVESIDEARRLGRTALLARTAGGTALDTLVRVVLCGHEAGEDAFGGAVAPMDPGAWIRAGLVEADGGVVRACALLTPLASPDGVVVLAADLAVRDGSRPRADYVMGAASSSMTLSNITVRRRAESALDLGTGCGVQAVMAASHCGGLIATDTNPRALEFTAFNAALNGLRNIEVRGGSLFEPVGGMMFDLIVSNPPFVISPSREFIYRDGGMHGDGISQAVVGGAATRLNPGGFACFLCNWAHMKGRDWQERIASWVDGSGCDLWVMRSWASDPSEYAARWLTHSENLSGEPLRERHREWMEYYQAAGIEAMGSGVVLLRRRAEGGGCWARFSESPEKMLGPCGDQAARMMEAWERVLALGDDGALVRARVRVSPDLRITRETRPATPEEGGEGWALTTARVRISRGLAYEGTLDPVTLGVLGNLDGRSPVGDVIASVGAGLGLDPARLLRPVLGVVRKWLELGMVEPVGAPVGTPGAGLGVAG